MAFKLLTSSVLNLVVLALIVALSLIMLGPSQGFMAQVGSKSYEYNATNSALYAIGDIPDWYGLLILAIIFLGFLGIIFTIRDMQKSRA